MLDVIDVPGPLRLGRHRHRPLRTRGAARRPRASRSTSHARTLDQLSTAVAIFDRAKRLVFHNAAYRPLWSLDPAFLDSRPLDGEILDRLRAERRLPEQADFRAWKAGLHGAPTRPSRPSETIWYLPDGRTLRVVTNPNPKGGVIYLFDDVTERYHLESHFNALIRVQGETLDTLKEAVAVFGTDGRLKLFNPAFADDLAARRRQARRPARISTRSPSPCAPLSVDVEVWTELRSSVVGPARRAPRLRAAAARGATARSSTAPPRPCPTARRC